VPFRPLLRDLTVSEEAVSVEVLQTVLEEEQQQQTLLVVLHYYCYWMQQVLVVVFPLPS
jgi:hypothetical protein